MEKNKDFIFKSFTVSQNGAAMKVGTDGVLVGAWADLGSANDVMDAGAGNGLISLMLAQRFPAANILAVEIDTDAAGLCECNFLKSPFSSRLRLVNVDFLEFDYGERFAHIVSNPPFYISGRQTGSENRNKARIAENMPAEGFAAACKRILRDRGKVSVIYPFRYLDEIKKAFGEQGFYVSRLCIVKGRAELPPKRVLIEFSLSHKGVCRQSELVIENGRNEWTDAYKELTKEFFLKL